MGGCTLECWWMRGANGPMVDERWVDARWNARGCSVPTGRWSMEDGWMHAGTLVDVRCQPADGRRKTGECTLKSPLSKAVQALGAPERPLVWPSTAPLWSVHPRMRMSEAEKR